MRQIGTSPVPRISTATSRRVSVLSVKEKHEKHPSSLSQGKSLGYQGPSSHPSKGSLEVHREGDLFEEDA